MSSPLAVERHVAPSKALVGVPKPGPYGRRAATLAARIAMHIETLVPRGRARCLDIGCGDMAVAEAVQELAPRTVWSCIDVRPVPPDAQGEARWSKYAQFDGKKVPYPDDQFDVAVQPIGNGVDPLQPRGARTGSRHGRRDRHRPGRTRDHRRLATGSNVFGRHR